MALASRVADCYILSEQQGQRIVDVVDEAGEKVWIWFV